MAHKVKVLRRVGPGRVEIAEEPSRDLRPGEARLRSVVSGISHGTELNLYNGTSPFENSYFDRDLRLFRPRPDQPDEPGQQSHSGLGYEMVSEVVEVARDVEGVRTGDIVHTPTGHRTETVVDVERAIAAELPLTVIPTAERPQRGVFLSLAGVALQAVHDAYVKVGDTVVVSGLGVIGLLTVQLARMNGARVLAVDPDESRRTLAEDHGAEATIDPASGESVGHSVRIAAGGHGADTVIETSGTYRGLHAAIASVGVGGRVVSVGFYRGPVDTDLRLGEEWHHNRPTLVSSMGVWGCPHREHPQWNRRRIASTVTALLFSDRLDTTGLLSRTVPFETAPSVYEELAADPRSATKIAFSYG